MKILYIEDNEKLAVVVATLLRHHRYDVEHFALGQPAMERFRQVFESLDAVIVDLELPDAAGRDLITEMAEKRPGLPIVVYSGASGLKDRFELYSSGASALLSKPTSAQDLLDVLKGLIDLPPEAIR